MQYNSEELNEILKIFKIEAEEIIQELNDGLLILEKNPDDKTPLKKLFQLAHSLKSAARMIGFTSIQDVSHKVEDVLSFWRKDNIDVQPKYIEEIYKACDLIGFLIEKSIEQKSNYYDERITTILEKLESCTSKNVQEDEPKPVSYIEGKSVDINAILLEIMFVLDKEEENTVEDILLIFIDNVNQLQEYFEQTEYFDIRNKIDDLKQYLSNKNLNDIYISVCKEKFLDIKSDIHKLYKDLNIKPSFLTSKQEKTDEVNAQEELVKNRERVLNSLDFIISTIQKVKVNKSEVVDYQVKLQKIIELLNNKQAEEVLVSAIRILKLFSEKNTVVNNDSYLIILQSLYLVKRIITNEQENNQNNISSIQQRVSVVEDMFNSKSTSLVNQNEIKEKNSITKTTLSELQSNISAIELQEIKTLRVDTDKIDNLISRTGELLINGIKTREHIVELSKINSKLNTWNTNSKAIMNYLKYLDKKGFFSLQVDENAYAFFKKAQNFFYSNSEFVNELNNDLNRLYNVVSEDDNKLNQTVKEVEAIATGIRVLPLATIFHTFPRMIRDIAKEKNKQIDFVVTGSDTTVDKKIIEEIKMPLIHILRNAVSHGIETSEVRLKNGKKETGTIKLTAKIVENNLVITMFDDGYGINLLKVKKSAVHRGLLTIEEAEAMSNDQLMKLLFLPGFSTEDSVTNISGRGIGLDIVKTKITNLNGEISIDSELNKGCAVTIKIPLSMSLLKTFLLTVNGEKYALPISSIKYVLKIKKEEIFNKNGKDCILYEGLSVPVYSLSTVFGGSAEHFINNDVLTVVIIENQDRIAAFIADELLGDAEIFQKKLVAPILKIKNISGFTTLSTGEICLIINPYELIRNTVIEETISLLSLKNTALEDKLNELKNKKMVVFDKNNRFDFILNDFRSMCNTINVFNNINSIYDYVLKNEIDFIICNIDSDSDDVVRLIKYIKSDESFMNIKWIIFSDLSEYEVSEKIKEYKYSLYLRFANYQKDEFIKQLLNLI